MGMIKLGKASQTLVVIGLAALIMDASTSDLLHLGAYLPASAAISFVLVLIFMRLEAGLLRGLRGKLLAAVFVSAAAAIISACSASTDASVNPIAVLLS